MRVLFIPSGDDKYGAPKSMMELVGNLKSKHGVEPIVMTCSDGAINRWCEENKIENYVLGQGSFMVVGGSNWFRKIVKHSMYPLLRYKYLKDNEKAKVRIKELLQNKNIDIVHTNVNRVDIGGFFAQEYGIPHIWHLREFGKEDYNCMYLRPDAIAYMNRVTTRFVAISYAVKDAWSKKGLDSEKVNVIYNGIDLTKYPKEMPGHAHLPKEKIRIVFAGIISETKGQMYLIKAINLLPDNMRQRIQVDFYGGGRKGYIRHLQQYVNNRRLDKVIHFRGYCHNIPEVLPQYDIGIVASRAEAFGRVTVEYMAAGLGVIASDTGANPEIITHEENGLIYRYGNIQALKECIERLLEDGALLKKIRINAFSSVQKKYSMERCADEVFALYKDVLGR